MQRKKRQLRMFCAIFLMVLLTGSGMLVLAVETDTIIPPTSQSNTESSTGETSEYIPVETPAVSTIEPVQTPTPPASSSITEPTPTPTAIIEPTPTPTDELVITPTPSNVQEITPTPYVPQDTDDDDDDNTAGTVISTPTPTPTPTAAPKSGTIERPKVTLSPSDESTNEAKESDYVEFARVNLQQNSLASNMFYGGVALIALGIAGMVVLIILFIKNRRYARNANEGIFEEIEEAEIRGYYPGLVSKYEDADADVVYDDDPYAQYANTGDVILPETSSIYTGEFEPVSSYENNRLEDTHSFEHYQNSPPAYQQPSPDAPKPVSPPKPPQKPGFTTEEILREFLNGEKDGHSY